MECEEVYLPQRVAQPVFVHVAVFLPRQSAKARPAKTDVMRRESNILLDLVWWAGLIKVMKKTVGSSLGVDDIAEVKPGPNFTSALRCWPVSGVTVNCYFSRGRMVNYDSIYLSFLSVNLSWSADN